MNSSTTSHDPSKSPSPTLFDIFEYPSSTDNRLDSSRMKMDVRIYPNDEDTVKCQAKSDSNITEGTYKIQIYPYAYEATNTDLIRAMPRPDPSSLTLNHHKPLTTFAPYLTSLLQNVPTLQMRVANLSCYDHISKCKAKLTWRPLDEGGDGKSWKGVIQVDCTPGTLIDCRWTKHDQELINKERREWMVIPYDPGNWNYDDPDEIVRFSALRNQRQINEELSRLFENPSTTGTTGTSEVVGEKMNKQKTLDSTKIKEVNWRTNRPSEMSIDTIQTFGDTMEIPIGYNSMNRSDLTNNQLIGIDNKTEDEELTKVLFWSNRLINSLPFRKSCEEDEDEDNRAMFLSQFELKCQTWTKDDPHGYSFEVYIDQDQFPNGSASKNQNKAGPSDNPDWRSNRIWIRDYRKN